MNVSIINIGNELLIGQVVNSNAAMMSRKLIAAGIDVKEIAVIGDSADAISTTLRRLHRTSDAVIMTGGLGPTKDDITKQVLCDFYGSVLVENPEALANIQRIFDARGYELTPLNRRQAWVPECCTMINNILGTAPAMWFESGTRRRKVVVSLPGVPFEAENLMDTEIIPRLKSYFQTGIIINKNILVQGIGESFLSDLIEPWETGLPQCMSLAYLPQAGMVKLRLTAKGDNHDELVNGVMREVKKLYLLAGQYIVGEDLETIPEAVARIFSMNALTLSTAESCTGGALASKLTALSGASKYFRGGVVAYSNDVKMDILGVRRETLESQGAVSEATVREMAEGIRSRTSSDYGVATSGVAGPTGGTDDKPVGTVWIAIAGPRGTETRLKKFGDDRLRTIERACNEVFSMLINQIKEREQ